MFLGCALVPQLFHVPRMFSFVVSWLHVPPMCLGCVLAAHWMCLGCSLDVPWLPSGSALDARLSEA